MLPSQKFALNQFLVYHPSTAGFEEVVNMVRRSSIQVKVKPEFKVGSVADLIVSAERDVAAVITQTNGVNEPVAKRPGRNM